MTEASDKLAKSRLAIYECVARRERRHDPREETAYGFESGAGYPDEEPPPGGGWFGHLSHAVRTWWRYHPAHMAVDLAAPLARSYARRKPWQLVGISFATGAALTFARPWRLISLTTLAVAVLKSSQLSNLLMAAMSAADYRHDGNRPE
jgi:hypothetical protein